MLKSVITVPVDVRMLYLAFMHKRQTLYTLNPPLPRPLRQGLDDATLRQSRETLMRHSSQVSKGKPAVWLWSLLGFLCLSLSVVMIFVDRGIRLMP